MCSVKNSKTVPKSLVLVLVSTATTVATVWLTMTTLTRNMDSLVENQLITSIKLVNRWELATDVSKTNTKVILFTDWLTNEIIWSLWSIWSNILQQHFEQLLTGILDENGETTCKPETTKYRFSFFEDGTIDCSKNKPGCKLDLCLCDKEFAETVATHEVNISL